MLIPMQEPTDCQLRNYWAKVDERDNDDCWNWIGCCTNGYGRFWLGSSQYLAHRVAYFLAKGDPGDLCVCHSCDNRKCCNPAHLWLGTYRDNARDSARKGRRSHLVGDASTRHTLTEKQVRAIKHAQITPYFGIGTALGKRFNVSHQVISDIKTGKVWSHVHV